MPQLDISKYQNEAHEEGNISTQDAQNMLLLAANHKEKTIKST